MQAIEHRSLESVISAGRAELNAYMAALLLQPRLHTGDAVVVPKDRLRHYIRSAKEQLRGRQGTVQYDAGVNQYMVAFEATDDRPAFEKVIPLANLEKVSD
ncbi:hypothetical protein DV532_26350 (plasmid) [Pseudomonas sp. Leaf58]|uniref:hypothetical protein n=1 Tax=Pseudomonas sp. Leaf58 TaxID=1736226 RepID=UPI0006F98558|nr:hypothetical protein [Pseudomonas sp. Leaf58]AYG47808.1 hypothetical protein DV532_26350 [Pseudomonas sp. Leaf58]KQN62625.1 hypothetical protein ASF02_10790 [Pseudomonas sp. Leaf58]